MMGDITNHDRLKLKLAAVKFKAAQDKLFTAYNALSTISNQSFNKTAESVVSTIGDLQLAVMTIEKNCHATVTSRTKNK